MNSHFRIKNTEGDDIVTIDLHTGKVTLVDPDHVDEAADRFWSAVRALHDGKFKDVVLCAAVPPNPGDIIVRPGNGSSSGRGGDVTIHVDDVAVQRLDAAAKI